MSAATPRFHLIHDPWITARYLDGTTADVSIRTAFHDAARIRDLGGEVPTQTFAIVRLLLAILYRATMTDGDEGWSRAAWKEDWEAGLPLDHIDDYLDKYADRFWLLHPTRPFFQVADLRTAKGEVKDTSALIFDLPSNNRLFTTRSGDTALRLSFAEAARWLVNAQAFDASGIKSGAVGDDRVKGGRGYPIGLAWAGLLGGVLVEGASLQQTLLLNLVMPGEAAGFRLRTDDVPVWERDDADTAAERTIRPAGPVQLFTWQSRRIRLVADGDRTTGCVLANGDALTPQNQFTHEPMTAWRYSEPQSKKRGETTYMPREHRPERAFWRGIGALLVAHEGQSRPPASIEAIALRREDGTIPHDLTVRFRAIGVVYGSNNSVVDDIIDDRLGVSTALLRKGNEALAGAAESAVQRADEGVRALKRLAQNLDRAAGGDGEGPSTRADASAYAALDGPYRTWLSKLDGSRDAAEALDEWKTIAYRTLRTLGDDIIRDAGPAAWTGREVSTPRGPELITTSRAQSWFLRALYTALAAPAPTPIEEAIA